MLDWKALQVLCDIYPKQQDLITLDVGIKELLFPCQHSIATSVHSFIMGVPMH